MIFHKHKYEIIETYQFENDLKNMHGVRMDGFTARELAKRVVITVCKCEVCGKVKHVKTEF